MKPREPVEIAAIALPVIAEAVAVVLFIACAAVLLIVFADRVPV